MKKLVLICVSVSVLFVNALQANTSFFIENQFKITNNLVDSLEQTFLSGHVTDAKTGEDLIGSNVVVYKNDVMKQGYTTDFDGTYTITVLGRGTYDVEVSAFGYLKIRKKGVVLLNNKMTTLDVKMVEDSTMTISVNAEVFKVPIILNDNINGNGNGVISSDVIKYLPERDAKEEVVKSILEIENDNGISTGNGRSGTTNYYVDGVRISGKGLLPPVKPTLRQKIKKSFKQIRERLKL